MDDQNFRKKCKTDIIIEASNVEQKEIGYKQRVHQNVTLQNNKYPQFMQNPLMIETNPQQTPHINYEFYIDIQMPNMKNQNIQGGKDKQISQHSQIFLDNMEKFDYEKQIKNNIQQNNTSYSTNISANISFGNPEQQNLQTGILAIDNLDDLKQCPYFNPKTPEQYSYEKQIQKINNQNQENKNKVTIEQIPSNPIAESQDKKNKIARNQEQKTQYQVKQKKYVQNNTIPGYVDQPETELIYQFAATTNYHGTPCCFNLLYSDDCFLKWVFDLLFQCLFLPLRIIGFIIKSICSLCCKQLSEDCFLSCQNCFYFPFQCFGEWMNQCSFSWKNFCCSGIENIPVTKFSKNANCLQKQCLKFVYFFKNCCNFPNMCRKTYLRCSKCFTDCISCCLDCSY